MRITGEMLRSLESITYETTQMLAVLDDARAGIASSDLREAKRRVLDLRAGAHELTEWLSEARLEEPRN
jgi:hypothetical protein